MTANFVLSVHADPRWNTEVNKMSRITKKIEKRIEEELINKGQFLRNLIIRSMEQTPRTGRIYKRGKKFHIASSPGYPPAPDTGQLKRSIILDIRRGLVIKDFEVEVGTNIKGKTYREGYPEFLEKGTSRMEARPWLEPAYNQMKDFEAQQMLLSILPTIGII